MTEFKGRLISHPVLGPVWRPLADVALRNADAVVECEMLVDSGADMTLIPYQIGLELGYQVGPEEIREVRGIGDTVVPYVLREAVLTVGSTEARIRVAWALVDEVSVIMGRLDVFDRFRVEFDQRERVVRFVSKQ